MKSISRQIIIAITEPLNRRICFFLTADAYNSISKRKLFIFRE